MTKEHYMSKRNTKVVWQQVPAVAKLQAMIGKHKRSTDRMRAEFLIKGFWQVGGLSDSLLDEVRELTAIAEADFAEYCAARA
jgi:hypothetical protein